MRNNTDSALTFEVLNSKHDRAHFTCGNTALDTYLKTQSSQDVKKNITAVFVLTIESKKIAGYYTLSQCSVHLDMIPEEIAWKLTRQHIIPTTLIGRLAVDDFCKGKGYGEMLLMDALYRSFIGSQQIASWAVIVDAKDEIAVSFYKKYGFIELRTNPMRLFIPMVTIKSLFTE